MGAGERSVKCILKDTVKIVEKIREIKRNSTWRDPQGTRTQLIPGRHGNPGFKKESQPKDKEKRPGASSMEEALVKYTERAFLRLPQCLVKHETLTNMSSVNKMLQGKV